MITPTRNNEYGISNEEYARIIQDLQNHYPKRDTPPGLVIVTDEPLTPHFTVLDNIKAAIGAFFGLTCSAIYIGLVGYIVFSLLMFVV